MPPVFDGCLPEEFLAYQVSREVRDFERTAVGTLSPVPLLGVLHARAHHARHGKFLFFGSEDTPVTDGSKELFDLAQRGKLDLFFLSGAQVDRKGNINLTCIGEYGAPRVRLPGGAGSAMLYYMTRRVVLFTLLHSPRVFVERCDFITSAGNTPRYPWRRGGPTKLITPLCTMEYDGTAAEWRLASLHPGVSYAEASRETGFPLRPEKAAETPSPSPDDVALLRAQIPALKKSYPVFAGELSRKIG
ncbi:MAG TPA: CoA-transferase [Candidatus Deferrimicrobiaceae bacterium]|nr:CoA-transferase [Candidatus Deferrimicrobiaceae bacterium]